MVNQSYRKKLATVFALLALTVIACQKNNVIASENEGKSVANNGAETPADEVGVSTKNVISREESLVVYYFHGNYRCRSCKTIEAYTEEAVKTGFKEQLASGRIEWRPVNTDESGNEHYAADYKLYTKSVILSDLKGGRETRWKNLDQVWRLLRDKPAFISYVQQEVKAYLEGR